MFESLSTRLQDVFKTLRGETRLITDDEEILRDRRIRLSLPEQLLGIAQRGCAVDGHFYSVKRIKQGGRPERSAVRVRIPESGHGLQMVGGCLLYTSPSPRDS